MRKITSGFCKLKNTGNPISLKVFPWSLSRKYNQYLTQVISLDENMNSLTECLDEFSINIEKEKLRALGERNKWESESENRKKKMMDLNNMLNEKKAELDRYTVEL